MQRVACTKAAVPLPPSTAWFRTSSAIQRVIHTTPVPLTSLLGTSMTLRTPPTRPPRPTLCVQHSRWHVHHPRHWALGCEEREFAMMTRREALLTGLFGAGTLGL